MPVEARGERHVTDFTTKSYFTRATNARAFEMKDADNLGMPPPSSTEAISLYAAVRREGRVVAHEKESMK